MTTKLIFASEICHRCGGTGRMPFSVCHGICFKCSGRGTELTRSGKSASAKWSALRDTRTAIPIEQVTPGMRLRHELWSPSGSLRYTATVLEVGPDPLNEGFTKVTFSVPTSRPGWGERCHLIQKGGALYRPVTAEDIEAFAEAYPRLKSYHIARDPAPGNLGVDTKATPV